MKYHVIRSFRDKDTGITYRRGKKNYVTDSIERANQLQEAGFLDDEILPRFAYIPVYNWLDGSAYKYYQFVKSKYGGLVINARGFTLRQHLIKYGPDIVFVHGDWQTSHTEAINLKIPYILIEQDVFSMRIDATKEQLERERRMLESAAGIIFTSEEMLEYCDSKYKLPDTELIHLRPFKSDIDFEPLPKLPGKNLVYAGGIVKRSRKETPYGYRAYHEIFKAFINAGWNVHLYACDVNQEALPEYQEIGCITHNYVPYTELLKEMSQYTAGLQSYNKEGVPEKAYAYTQQCRPNKTWDYLAAGIATIGFQAGSAAELYDGKWGVKINDLKPKTLKGLAKMLPIITEDMRRSEVMEHDMYKVDRLVEKVLGKAK